MLYMEKIIRYVYGDGAFGIWQQNQFFFFLIRRRLAVTLSWSSRQWARSMCLAASCAARFYWRTTSIGAFCGEIDYLRICFCWWTTSRSNSAGRLPADCFCLWRTTSRSNFCREMTCEFLCLFCLYCKWAHQSECFVSFRQIDRPHILHITSLTTLMGT